MQQPIAILDSGVGGLTVVKEVIRQLPQEEIIYFGDTARTPYGPRQADEVMLFTRQIVDYLIQHDPKMIVVACNTATAIALEDIRKRVSIPVVGVIYPGARAAIKSTRTGVVGVIGTEGTIRSGAYVTALNAIAPHIQVVSKACPKLVPLVEQGLFDGDEAWNTVQESLATLIRQPIDCLIMGCTHYPFLSDLIGASMGPDVKLISSAEETAREISTVLHHQHQLAQIDDHHHPKHRFYCSGDPELFKRIAQMWLGEQVAVSPVVWKVSNIV